MTTANGILDASAIGDIAGSLFVPGPLGLLQPVTSRQVFPEQGLSDGSVQTLTYRSSHPIEEDCPFVVLVYVNSAELVATQTSDVTYTASYDYVPAATIGGNLNSIPVLRVTFGGKNSLTLSPKASGIPILFLAPSRKVTACSSAHARLWIHSEKNGRLA